MASTSVALSTEPIDVAHSSNLNLQPSQSYTLQYTGAAVCYITSQSSLADAVPKNAAIVPSNGWVKITPVAGEGVYAWCLPVGGGGGGYLALHPNIEPVAR